MTNLLGWVTPDGELRYLGNHESTLKLATGKQLPDIPESEWKEFDLRDDLKYPVKVKDQNGKGACNGHAAASSLEIARYVSGADYVALSPWLVYADLCNGWDVGSNIAEALVYLENKGTCTESLVPYATINPSRIPATARTDAKRFKIEIGYRLNTFNDLCIAAQLRMPFNFSVPVNANFNVLDKNGVPGNRAGTHNHAVTGGLGMKQLPSGKWAILMQNSWGTQWGWNGYCWITDRNVAGTSWDAYCVSATVADPNNLPPVFA